MTTERKYRRFTPEFKREAVRQMSDSNKHCTQLTRELGIRVNQLYKKIKGTDLFFTPISLTNHRVIRQRRCLKSN